MDVTRMPIMLMLRRLEFSSNQIIGSVPYACCPMCFRPRIPIRIDNPKTTIEGGHRADCKLRALILELREIQ